MTGWIMALIAALAAAYMAVFIINPAVDCLVRDGYPKAGYVGVECVGGVP